MLHIKRPLQAATLEQDDIASLQFPLWCSEKEDGIRGITSGIGIVSKWLKPLPNFFLQNTFLHFPAGLEGELVCIDPHTNEQEPFEVTESKVMSQQGRFTFFFYIFDYYTNNLKFASYRSRYATMLQKFDGFGGKSGAIANIINPVQQIHVYSVQEVEQLLRDAILKGKEGVCLRDPNGQYKFGRSTLNEQLFIKLKPWLDDEAFIVGFTQKMKNGNEQTIDALGYARRSKHQDNLQACNQIGSIIAKSDKFPDTFRVGSGIKHDLAAKIFADMPSYIGCPFTFRYRTLTAYGVPKHARFGRFRLHAV